MTVTTEAASYAGVYFHRFYAPVLMAFIKFAALNRGNDDDEDSFPIRSHYVPVLYSRDVNKFAQRGWAELCAWVMPVYRWRAPITVLREIIFPDIKSYVSRALHARTTGTGRETRKLPPSHGNREVFMMGIKSAKASLADEPEYRFFFHFIRVVPFNMIPYKRDIVYAHGCYICYINLMRIKLDSS